jgi:very-short-patch-repair endonuclease
MTPKELKPRQALNKAFLKVKPNRAEIEVFKRNLIALLDSTNDTESEEFHKNLVSDFLKDTYYKQNHFINTKGRNDLVIHNGTNSASTVGVIIEAKKPTNKGEMITSKKLNTKAFQELVLYYLRERITHKNLDVKHLVATNINEWFIFDEHLFERLFAQNKSFVKQFENFEASKKTTDVFYKEIAEPFIAGITSEIEFTYFNLQDFQKPLRNTDKADDNSLIALFKLLSPEHLLKLPFINDSNSLDKRFYSELLHIIGLTETKDGSKKLIGRNKEGERHTGTILEDAIIQLDSLDKLGRLDKPGQYGNTQQERLFNVALELTITWINRILFLKLLEAQLITYHKGDKPARPAGGSYSFLNLDKIKNYDDLNSLFFQVLARKYEERNEDVKRAFEKVPYLNSSLFEPTDMEQVTLFISNLKDDKTIPIFSQTVLKDQQGKKRTGNISTLQYLFEFLDAYDFGAEGGEEIQEDNKTLINASVLGLIFEKINGYKDGSFFTPGFITMYMCRETIRKAVVQKFNEAATKSPLERGFRGVLHPTAHPKGVIHSTAHPHAVSNPPEITRRDIIPYNPKLKEIARELRKNSTRSEIILWTALKGKFEGKYDFHRQKPLDNYIADFFCYELKLVIEIDGETHNWEEVQQKDFQKESRFNELGLNVLRFPDADILNQLDATLGTLKQYIQGFEAGSLADLIYEDSPLNPYTGHKGITDTPLNPLSGGDLNASSPGVAFNSLEDVYEQIGDDRMFTRQQANDIVNSIKICDPAVGSGHFLVSALNEMIAVKNDLKILQDRDGKRLKEYQVEVVNDELIVTDEEGDLFEYNPGNKESQRIQETLFHEKHTIIENCLFGVDINSNSVKICRLRLWIELLKNAYYKNATELETLPNIDINIKCGNSLVSRFAIDADLKQALKKSKWTIDSYRIAVDTYRNAESKEQKREMERLIADIKSDFRSEISLNDPKIKKLRKLSGELFQMTNQQQLFEMGKKEKADWNKKVQQLTQETKKLETEIEEIKANKIFENAFEWRFEFPEVLNDEGDFVGFDVVIGNPPYGASLSENEKQWLLNKFKNQDYQLDTYLLFIEQVYSLMREFAEFTFIIPNTWITNLKFKKIRRFIFENTFVHEIVHYNKAVFEEAVVDTEVLFFKKLRKPNLNVSIKVAQNINQFVANNVSQVDWIESQGEPVNINISKSENGIKLKLEKHPNLNEFVNIVVGLKPYQKGKGKPKQTESDVKRRVFDATSKLGDDYYKLLRGSDINKYCTNWTSGVWLKYGDHIAEPRYTANFFNDEKIVVRQTSDKLIATIDTDKFLCMNNLHVITRLKEGKEVSFKFLLGLINSKLLDFYYTLLNPEKGEALAEVKKENLSRLPINTENKFIEKEITELVDGILSKKRIDIKAETIELEAQIDQLVYALYELTEEEIAIVEESAK